MQTPGLGASAYLDVPGYLRATTGQETASLLGLNTTLAGTGTLAAGATTLPVGASAGWATGPLWLLDGPYSEVIQITGAPDATHLTLAAPGTLLAHAPDVSLSQAGTGGSLAEALLRASAWIESYCGQGAPGDRSLFAVARTERWGMPGPRAWLDRDGVLAVRPGHFPVQAATALSLDDGHGAVLGLDLTSAELASGGRLVEVALPSALPGQSVGYEPLAPVGWSRARRTWAVLTYSGGISVGAVPYDVQQACVWIASELLAQRRNPTGAAEVRLGKLDLQQRPRNDPTGASLLILRAREALDPYRERGV